jgi:N-acetylneuraminic acid mutarotase
MSVLTPKRLFLCVVAVLTAGSALASHPSPRAYPRIAYDAKNDVTVLFGGRGPVDKATGGSHSSNETWLFGGATWAQRFPQTVPPGRAVHSMVAGKEGRVYMFGGRQEGADSDAVATFLNDLWVWENDNWTRIDESSASRPSPRQYSSLAFDSDRDVLVLFGGQVFGGEKGDELVPNFETWEFSLTTNQWTQVATGAEVPVGKPHTVYDAATKKVVMMGVTANVESTPLMYSYDTATKTWTKLTPPKFPTCTNEGQFFVQNSGRLLYFGGFCRTGTPPLEEVFEFDGTTWTKLTTGLAARGLGQATTWDPEKDRAVIFGGSLIATPGNLVSFTNFYENLKFLPVNESQVRPQGRSLMALDLNPQKDRLVMYGGLSEFTTLYVNDFWAFQNGHWLVGPDNLDAPLGGCDNPLSALDTDRSKLVLVCNGNEVWEFDGTAWKEFTEQEPIPNARRFAAMVYDQKIKKTVLFGGFLNNNYRNDTWTWDGAKWAELKIDNDDRPPHRGTMAMWFDPLAQKTILYGGIGRGSLNEKVKRFADMWAFDGSKWVDMAITATPGIRFRPLQTIDSTGKVVIFGGLRAEELDKDSFRQFFGDDMWVWDGSTSKWTEIQQPAHRPAPRQNGALGVDPATGKLMLFGGYGDGFYYSDTWLWDGTTWSPVLELITGKRRSVR